MPRVVYPGDELGESELLDALGAGAIDAIARGAVGNSDAAYICGCRFVVGVLDNKVEMAVLRLLSKLRNWLLVLMRR